ncbi:DNA-binding transcriptional MerR regulator [Parvibaculum indicum]|uniref:MerR family transcriptional regulator n=1 Tax=Parvibaculum indicum TaxID=562969 RepID=UPI00141D92AF|nr:MerR family DNA-binding transcriptional regulator [Parvibaculum indicum]NIJ42910.1 DNA-binding transcriptional MerR regulator [Parvibaculum indicum]
MDQQTSDHAVLAGGHEGDKHGPCPTFSITQLAEEFGLTTRAIRFYEDKGLLSPERQGQTRVYHPRDRARLILIVRGKNVGLALTEIKEILDHYDPTEGCETQDRIALEKFRKRITSLERQRDEIGLQVATLQEACRRLEERIAADGNSGKDAPRKRREASTG